MAYKVFIRVGKSTMGSTPLKNKASVRAWVRRNPMGNTNTKVRITNLRTKKTLILTKSGASIFGNKIYNI